MRSRLRKNRTRSTRPLALATIVPRAGREEGRTVLIVVVDIVKVENPYVWVRRGFQNKEDMAVDNI